MSDVVNVRVKVTNLLDQQITGIIHSFNPSQSVLALKLDPSKIRIINTAFVKAVQVVPPHYKKYNNSHKYSHPRPSKVDLRKLEADLNESIARYRPEQPKSEGKPEGKSEGKPETKPEQKSESKPDKPKPSHTQKQHSKRRDSSAHALTIFNNLTAKFGKENVQWLSNDSINVFKDVVIAKPYTLNKMGGKRSPRAEEVKNALREILLDVGPGKRGG
ncbi:hypothetical protein CA3LBN_001928 [Candidozyma haemuli]|uniref:AD domain-containing protein n=1 Tax=Candidozyma haemuli TaxID=45357 RepID=A0ABX8I715_9ASCO|nr:hypothetical protein CA3LBN_001928 [[Candida] haemuloni]